MNNRRRGERVLLDETTEITLIEQDYQTKGPFTVDEFSYEFGRKHGVHLNLLLTGLRFMGPVDLKDGQEFSFLLPDQPEPLHGRVMWKKNGSESDFIYGIKILQDINRRRADRNDLDETVEMHVIDPVQAGHHAYVDEMSYGLIRKQGVHLSPGVTGLRFRSTMDLLKEQIIYFQLPSEDEVLRGTIVWKVPKDNQWLYGVQVS